MSTSRMCVVHRVGSSAGGTQHHHSTLTDMTTELGPARVRLRTPADLIDAVPYLVGFTPQNSLVMLALHGERKRLGIVSRVDIPDPRHAAALAAGAADYLVSDGADQAAAIFYPP
ncbi:MAG: DUF4192 family protein, partial [Acidothermaceae bacterium]